MIKDILQKNHIGLGFGLMVLLVNQSVAMLPSPRSIEHLAFSNDSSQLLYIAYPSRAETTVVNRVNTSNGVAVSRTQLSIKQRILGFTPDGFKTVVFDWKGLNVLHNKTGKVLRTLKVPSLTRPSQYLLPTAVTNKSGTAQLFHSANRRVLNVIHTGNGIVLAKMELPVGALHAIGISQNGRNVAYLLDGSSNKSQLHLYDVYQKKVVKVLDLPKVQEYPVSLGVITFSPKGKYLVVGNNLVDLMSDEITLLARHTMHEPAVFTPNGRFVIVSAGRGQLLRYDLSNKQKHGINLGLPNHCLVSKAVDISPNERFIAYGSSCLQSRGEAVYISVLNATDGSLRKVLTVTP